MKRWFLAVAVVLLGWVPLQAHFLWLLPVGTNQAKLIFSDSLKPDDPALLDRVKDLRIYGHDKANKHIEMKYTKADDGFVIDVPKDVGIVCGSATYGIYQPANSKPALLSYNVLLYLNEGNYPCENCMPLQIQMGKQGMWTVKWEGEAMADCDVLLMGPTGFAKQTKKTDKNGQVMFDWGSMPKGIYGLRVGQTVKEAGDLDGKKYEEQRIYSTFVFKKD